MIDQKSEQRRVKEQGVPIERLRELVAYDPETGIFTSRVTRGRCGRWPAGRRMGAVMAGGYRSLSIDGAFYYEHRVAVAMMTGQWPEHEVDHINLDRADNRWVNLREASRAENCRNHPGYPSSRLGSYKGITHHGDGRWRAQIVLAGKCHYLGLFFTQEEAHQAYVIASRNLHGDRGRIGAP